MLAVIIATVIVVCHYKRMNLTNFCPEPSSYSMNSATPKDSQRVSQLPRQKVSLFSSGRQTDIDKQTKELSFPEKKLGLEPKSRFWKLVFLFVLDGHGVGRQDYIWTACSTQCIFSLKVALVCNRNWHNYILPVLNIKRVVRIWKFESCNLSKNFS